MNRHRVFISSTIDDLRAEREAVATTLTSLGFFEVVRVEALPASGESSERICLDEVRATEALILILDARYGYVPVDGNPEGLSVTHIEYREARRLDHPVYAFISTRAEREPLLEVFVAEVSDYGTGVFRRTWSSLDDLGREARRSAVAWLSRDLRAGRAREAADLVVAERGSFFLDAGAVDVQIDAAPAWLATTIGHLEALCLARYLPAPSVSPTSTTAEFAMALRIGWTGQSPDVTLVFQPDERDGATASLPELVVPLSSASEALCAATAVALVEAGTGDLGEATAGLAEVASGLGNVSDPNMEVLLRSAAVLSAFNQGRMSDAIVRSLLALPQLQPGTVSDGLFCLIAAEVRLEAAGAWRAIEQTERIAFSLLATVIGRGDATPEALYNLGRRALRRSPKLGIALFDELLSAEPSYEERWYFHRDLGLLEYPAEHLSAAAVHYDHACHLKDNDSELWRQAGDARYYDGQWAEALLRYEKALEVDPIESYFVDFKAAFSRLRIGEGRPNDSGFRRASALSRRIATVGDALASAGRHRAAQVLFRAAKRVCWMTFDADRWLALYANQRGDYAEAAMRLEGALAWIPEDPRVRLNLVANQVFGLHGALGEDAIRNLRAALFHGGPEILDRFAIQVTNTRGRDALVLQARELLEAVAREREQWLERRGQVQAPEQHGGIIHIEIR